MRRHLVELAVKYGKELVDTSRALIDANERVAHACASFPQRQAGVFLELSSLHNLLAKERTLREESAAVIGCMTDEEIAYTNGEIERYHSSVFSTDALREAIRKDKDL